jgi:hypothetical protein
MGYLQLAESNPFNALAEVSPNAMKFYVFIPEGYRGATKDMYIREDVLDDLPPATFSQIMYELDEYQNTGLSASKEEREKQRAERKAGREERKNTRATAGKTRQDARTERQRLRSESKGKGAGSFAGILGNITGTAKDIFGKGNVDVAAGSGDFSLDYSAAPEESFFSRYKIPIILGSVAVIGGGILLFTRKK